MPPLSIAEDELHRVTGTTYDAIKTITEE